MSNPNDQHTDELISAYLDGEVTPQQRDQVEQRLRTDPQWQQTLEELRTLRETLQALPRQKLDANFRQRVLQKVHEQSAAGAAVPASTTVAQAPPQGQASSARKILRGLMWATSAAAAATLLIVYTAPLQRDTARSVASNPSSPQEVDRVAERSEVPSAGTGMRGHFVPPEDELARPKVAFQEEDAALDSTASRGKAGWRLGEAIRIAPTVERQSGLAGSDADGMSLRKGAVSSKPNMSAATLEALPGVVEAAPPSDSESGFFARQGQDRRDDETGDGWTADAVVHIQLAATDKSAERLLVENLARNSIVVVREEQAQTALGVPSKPSPEQPDNSRNNSLYFQNQVAVDYAFGTPGAAEEPVQLWLVEATAPQITNAVHELQQEGAAVLATVPGPRRSSQWSAARAPQEQVARPTRHLEAAGTRQRSMPSAAVRQESGDAPLAIRAEDPFHPLASDEAASDEATDFSKGTNRVGQSSVATPAPTSVPRGTIAPARGLQLGRELEGLGTQAGDRPLQILFVLRGGSAASKVSDEIFEAGEAPPAKPIEPLDPP